MGDVAEVIGGGTPRTSEASYFEKGDIPWLTPADLSGYDEKFIGRGRRNITQLGLAESSARLMPSGTVLFTSRAPIGYVAIAANPMATNQGFKSFVLRDSLNPGYIYYYLKFATPIITEFASGTTFLEISGQNAKKIPVPVAPKREQRRIVQAIESHLTRLDDAVATLERVQRNLKRYRASVLKAAVEGRLVPTEAELARKENREYEPASVLLDRILKERKHRFIEDAAEKGRAKAEGKAKSVSKTWTGTDDEKTLAAERAKAAKKYREPTAPDTSELPELPEGWCWSSIDLLSHDVRYGSSSKCSKIANDNVPVMRMGNIVDGKLVFSNLKYLPSDHDEFPDLLLKEGDLLFNRTNSAELVGKCAAFKASTLTCSFASYLIRVRFLSSIQPDYVATYLNSSAGRQWIGTVVSQQVGQANVNGTKLKKCFVPVPPSLEQMRIVAEIERLDAMMETASESVAQNLSRCVRLRQSILKWAFEGKLVDQDPNDEPASALLERIKAEQSANQPPTKATRSRRRRKTA